MSSEDQWHLDKKVPVAIILTIALQSLAAVWWASSINSTVAQQQADITALKAGAQATAVSSAKFEQEMLEVHRVLDRLEEGQSKTNDLLSKLLTEGRNESIRRAP